MKLISLKCPSCGANLNVEEGQKVFYCNYCRGKVALDDEVQRMTIENAMESGYEFEKGRINARAEGIDKETLNDIRNLSVNLPKIRNKKTELIACRENIESLENKVKSYEDFFHRFSGIIGAAAVFILGLLIGLSMDSILFSIISVVIAIGVYFFLPKHIEKQRIEDESKLKDAKEHEERLKQEIEELEGTINEKVISADYQTDDALFYIYKVLENGRAGSIRDAINLYEEHCHKNKVLSMQEEQLRLQRQQNENLKNKNDSSALGKVVSNAVAGVGIVAGAKILKDIWDEIK